MKFLILDIQNASRFITDGKICLINEMVIDDNFEVENQKEILLNPCIDFDEYILKNLPYDKNKFDESKNFIEIYDELKMDLDGDEKVVIVRNGYNDVKLLNGECTKAMKVPFEFKFYDYNDLHTAYMKLDESINKVNFTFDGKNNVRLILESLKNISSLFKKSLREILLASVNSEGYLKDGFISFRRGKDIVNSGNENLINSDLNKNSNYKVFLRLLENLPETDGERVFGENIKISISAGFEITHFKAMVNLVMWLNNCGVKYVTDMNDCNMFIKYDMVNEYGKERKCNRYTKIEELKQNGAKIEIVTIDYILEKLGKNKEDLFYTPLPDISFIYGENSKSASSFKKYKRIIKNFGKV